MPAGKTFTYDLRSETEISAAFGTAEVGGVTP